MDMPWIEIDHSADQSDISSYLTSEYDWQAMFACQVKVLSHQDWFLFRWGLNAGTLFEEALERQKLFFESQHDLDRDLRVENPNRRALAFRYINIPGAGLTLVVLGKIFAQSQTEANERALEYYRALEAAFPYDYALSPAKNKEEFHEMSAWNILVQNKEPMSVAQIKRCEMPVGVDLQSPHLHGLWQSSGRAYEQLWRSLAGAPYPVVMNILLRSTMLYEGDAERLLSAADALSAMAAPPRMQRAFKVYKEWNDNYINRRLASWKKFFYLQIHVASTHEFDENFLRNVSAPFALTYPGQALPGYQIVFPAREKRVEWGRKIHNMDIVFGGSQLPVPRLSEVADLEEVFAAVRIPYTPPGRAAQFVDPK